MKTTTARIGKAVPRLAGGLKVLYEPCFDRGKERTAWREIAGTPMCRWCTSGLPDPEARGGSRRSARGKRAIDRPNIGGCNHRRASGDGFLSMAPG